MAEITNQALQDIAVQCVGDFFNHNIPLSESLCKQASARCLNSDQLQRAVEVTNTLAHINSLRVSSDRTSEFPLADYDNIMKMASLPEGFEPPANSDEQIEDTADDVDLTKTASEVDTFPDFNDAELGVHLYKEAQINSRALEMAEERAEILAKSLTKQAEEFKADPQGVELLSATIEGVGFNKISQLVWGEKKEYLDYADDLRLPKVGLEKAAALCDAVNDALLLTQEIQHRREMQKQAEEYLEGMKKEAFASLIGKAIGSTIAAPFRLVGNAVRKGGKNLVSGVADRFGTKINNLAADHPYGKKIGILPKKLKPETEKNTRKTMATLGTIGALADAATYNPSKNKVTGQSSDVFDTLY